LIIFFLIVMGDMKKPWLYLSLFFKNNREEYYERFNAVRQKGDWEGWLDFFLHGVAETADQVVTSSQKISQLFASDGIKIATLKRAGISATQAHEVLRKKAMTSAIEAAKVLGVSVPTARAALQNLNKLGIVKVLSGKGKERLYVYTELLLLLEQGAR
jgi:Fic family protein